MWYSLEMFGDQFATLTGMLLYRTVQAYASNFSATEWTLMSAGPFVPSKCCTCIFWASLAFCSLCTMPLYLEDRRLWENTGTEHTERTAHHKLNLL